ncbi:hypothetical protein CHCC5023_2688 [Bacillus paralicheniformis]|uniref:Uncharacterized protein n=1 Tax=Bacillus paralicheniformis TaxID=1648923 RepID=A0A7Z0WTE1_9BACI|nr:hypothetical protein B4121_3910 [Bacillus paralicheniformis]TWJ55490.1 hypothetical protein CHCC5023_2688 [Bacillus paralicheniformis]TWJ73301.1 hypothetical protein CHCC5019_0546 [Bacillus paralicheniformis]
MPFVSLLSFKSFHTCRIISRHKEIISLGDVDFDRFRNFFRGSINMKKTVKKMYGEKNRLI